MSTSSYSPGRRYLALRRWGLVGVNEHDDAKGDYNSHVPRHFNNRISGESRSSKTDQWFSDYAIGVSFALLVAALVGRKSRVVAFPAASRALANVSYSSTSATFRFWPSCGS